MSENSNLPTPKVAAAGVAGAVTLLVVFALGLLGIPVPAEVASALTLVLTVGAGYLKN